jgi:hypothetical protein
MGTQLGKKDDREYEEKEATARFEAALKSALNMPPKPLKDKPKVKTKPKSRAKKKD